MPIEILQKEVQVRDPTTHQFSDLAALRGGQGPQGLTGPGVPAGGTDGDVLVKNGATDYAATWTSTPPQMGSLATIEPTSTVTQKTQYVQGEYLVYNGKLYKVTASTITQGQTLTPGGNIADVAPDGGMNILDKKIKYQYGIYNVQFPQSGQLGDFQINLTPPQPDANYFPVLIAQSGNHNYLGVITPAQWDTTYITGSIYNFGLSSTTAERPVTVIFIRN